MTEVNPYIIRAILLHLPSAQDEAYRLHLLYAQRIGLIDANGLTAGGLYQAGLVKDLDSFNAALRAAKSTFANTDWPIVIYLLKKRTRNNYSNTQ